MRFRTLLFLLPAAVLSIPQSARAQVTMGAAASNGVMIDGVVRGTPAAEAGFQSGDVILEFNGRPVDRSEDLLALMQSVKRGAPLAFKISRGGRLMSFTSSPRIAPAQQGARSGQFALKVGQAYMFDHNAYEDSSGKSDVCLIVQMKSAGWVGYLASPKIKYFETRPDVARISHSEIETWKDYVFGPGLGYYLLRTPSNKYFLLRMTAFENQMAVPERWKQSFTFEEIEPR